MPGKNPNVNTPAGSNDTRSSNIMQSPRGIDYESLKQNPNAVSSAISNLGNTIQNSTQSLISSANQVLQHRADLNALQYSNKLYESVRSAEAERRLIKDAEELRQYDAKNISMWQEEIDKSGLMSTDQRNSFSQRITSLKFDYDTHANELKIKQVGDNLDLAHQNIATNALLVKQSPETYLLQMNDHRDSTIRELIATGSSEADAKKIANRYSTEQILAYANSPANKNGRIDAITKLQEADENGKYLILQDVPAVERIQLINKLRTDQGESNFESDMLKLTRGELISEKKVLNDPFTDNAQKSRLLANINSVREKQEKERNDAIISAAIKSPNGFLISPPQFEMTVQRLPPQIQDAFREKYVGMYDKYGKDPQGFISNSPAGRQMTREESYARQQMDGIQNPRMFSNTETNQVRNILVALSDPKEISLITRGEHPVMQGILTGAGYTDPKAQKQAMQRLLLETANETDDPTLFLNLKMHAANSESEASIRMNNTYTKIKGYDSKTKSLLRDESSKEFEKEFRTSEYGQYLYNNNRKTFDKIKEAGALYASQDPNFNPKVLQKNLNIKIIEKDNKYIHVNENIIPAKIVEKTLDIALKNYGTDKSTTEYLMKRFPEEGRKEITAQLENPKFREIIKNTGRWVSDGDVGYILQARGVENVIMNYGYIPIEKVNDSYSIYVPVENAETLARKNNYNMYRDYISNSEISSKIIQ